MQNVPPPPAVQPHWVPSNPSSDQSIPSSRSSHRPKCSNRDLTIIGMTIQIMREEGGIRALYRGLIPTALGVAPYVGINFAAYEWFRGIITPPGKNTVGRRLLCGALSGGGSGCSPYQYVLMCRMQEQYRRHSLTPLMFCDGRCRLLAWKVLDVNATVP